MDRPLIAVFGRTEKFGNQGLDQRVASIFRRLFGEHCGGQDFPALIVIVFDLQQGLGREHFAARQDQQIVFLVVDFVEQTQLTVLVGDAAR